MKTFQTFNEDIEERRAQARQRAIQLSQTARDRVAAYRKAQQQKAQERLEQQQREKEDEELIKKTKELVKRELKDS